MVSHHFPVRLTTVACVLALAGAHLVGQIGPAAGVGHPVGQNRRAALRSGPVGIPAQVAQAAARDGRVRIIIGLGVPFAAEGVLDAAEQAQQRFDIAAAQDAVEVALAPFQVGGIKRFHVIPAMGAEVDAASLQMLASMPGVSYIEEDALATPTLAESNAIIGSPVVWASGYTGAGQTVAILDTGVETTHPFFGGRVVSEACYSTTSVPDGSTSVCPGGVASATGPGTAAPCGASNCGHGTHVAGIAAGSGSTFHGVARGANIIAVQVFSQFSQSIGSFSTDQIAGMQRVYDLRNTFSIAAVNMSLGGGGFTTEAACDAANTTRKAMIDTLRSVDIATVIASGNDGYVDAISAPGCISTAVSVGSTTDGSNGATPSDQVSAFTNSASFLKLLAPGQVIYSSYPGSGFAFASGTSMAAPHVAGAWALLKSRFTGATVTQVLSALTTTGTEVLDPGNGLVFRRINVNLAMTSLGPTCTYALSRSAVSLSAAGGPRSVNVLTQAGCTWSATSNAVFLSITSGANGTGPGSVNYSVGRNDGIQRSGTLTIGGQTFTVTQSAAGGQVPLDLNEDGKLDLFWHHQTDGRILGWLMNGTTLTADAVITPSQVPDTTWKVVGAGDLDADGYVDIVWQNSADGRVSAWLMNGLTVREGTLFSIPQVADLQWKIRAVGDLNGDGRADLFWQHEGNGDLAAWLMNGLNVIDGTLLSPSRVSDTQWKIVGAADFDGNGSRDLVWHHQGDGRIAVWYMTGTTQMSGSLTNPSSVPDTNWKIRAVGDLDGDGRPDFLWQNIADGRISAWLMNGLNLVDGSLLSPPQVLDTNWHLVGPR